jgi:NAD-dependent dihydropyrimidine dehydrogenase PreA subunit
MDIAQTLRPALDPLGLIAFGAFHPVPADGVPGDPGTCVLIGNAGVGMWRAFARDLQGLTGQPAVDPLDDWVRRQLTALAGAHGATALFPSGGPPFLPFQRWAQRAGPARPSPLGLLIHPEYGLWHAYRGALVFADRRDLPPADSRPSPCDGCVAKPCLTACPVDAFSIAQGYNVAACAGHLDTSEGDDCNGLGCRARHACPVGRAHVYAPAQAAFHMTAFRRAQR